MSPASQPQPLPQSPHLRQSSAPSFQSPPIPSDPTPQALSQPNPSISVPQLTKPTLDALDTSEPETQGTKRRLESEEAEGKRARQKTGLIDTQSLYPPPSSSP
ncbi:hypothetical protein P692DRAFT_20839155, partial [Suillus brevipes Sb2]